jgi:hypothetical protein
LLTFTQHQFTWHITRLAFHIYMDWMRVAGSQVYLAYHSTGVSYLPGLDARGNGGPGVLCYFAMAFHIYLDVDERGDEGQVSSLFWTVLLSLAFQI